MRIKIIWAPTHSPGNYQPLRYSNYVEAETVPRVGEEVTFQDSDGGGQRSGVVQSVQHVFWGEDDRRSITVVIK